jgi:hypothetical protein
MQERRDHELHVIPRDPHQNNIVSKSTGGHEGVAQLNTSASGSGPAVETLEQNVQEVGACGASLGESIGDVPFRAIHLAIAEALAQLSVESTEALDDSRMHPNMGQNSKHCPPWQRWETAFYIERGKPE